MRHDPSHRFPCYASCKHSSTLLSHLLDPWPLAHLLGGNRCDALLFPDTDLVAEVEAARRIEQRNAEHHWVVGRAGQEEPAVRFDRSDSKDLKDGKSSDKAAVELKSMSRDDSKRPVDAKTGAAAGPGAAASAEAEAARKRQAKQVSEGALLVPFLTAMSYEKERVIDCLAVYPGDVSSALFLLCSGASVVFDA
jgi:hypothetical protein